MPNWNWRCRATLSQCHFERQWVCTQDVSMVRMHYTLYITSSFQY